MHNNFKYNLKGIAILIITLIILLLFLQFTLHFDNKYNTKSPSSQGGIVSLTESDLTGNDLTFLINDWFFSYGDANVENASSGKHTFIGQFSNYSWSNEEKHPLGTGTYRMYINYEGRDVITSIYFPEFFTGYHIWLDEKLVDKGRGSGTTDILMTKGTHVLTVSVSTEKGYYAGMYYPGAIGSRSAITKMEKINSFFYGLAFLIPLSLALFCFTLWKRDKTGVYKKFALLCFSFSIYMSYYFVHNWSLPLSTHWYFIEDLAFYAFLYFALSMSISISYTPRAFINKLVKTVALIMPIIEIILYFLTGKFDFAISLHGNLQDLYRLFILICLIIASTYILKHASKENNLILIGNCALSVGLLSNLINSNQYEPIYGLWQFEWCGLILVGLFTYFMTLQNKKILKENEEYQDHLEEMVEKRTQQLEYVLEERRSLFSDMAHDLKAPLFATKTFIDMIRLHSEGLDDQFMFYLNQVEKKQNEMAERVKSLNQLNAIDKITNPPTQINVKNLINDLYKEHNPEAVVKGIHLVIQGPSENLFVKAQQEKLMILFENLIYNSLRFTPPEGKITLSAQLSKSNPSMIRFSVKDTGCGISESDLPHVFERFYMGEAGKESGSGLGLYIVKTIAEEIGGKVSATSQLKKGSEFIILLPVLENPEL